MANPIKLDYRMRVNFGKVKAPIDIPDLLRLGIKSFQDFISKDSNIEKNIGQAFKSVFPIDDIHGRLRLELVDWNITEPKLTPEECKEKGLSYSGFLMAKLRLTLWDIDEKTGERVRVREIKEQDVYVGEIFLITERGSFVINGVEKVVIGQLHRSPGVIFKLLSQVGGRNQYYGQIIPDRGSWVEFETDAKGILYARIDRKKKFPAVIILKALGFEDDEILRLFYTPVRVSIKDGEVFVELNEDVAGKFYASEDIAVDGKTVVSRSKKITRRALKELLEKGVNRVPVRSSDLVNMYLATRVEVDDDIVGVPGVQITKELINRLKRKDSEFDVVYSEYNDPLIANTVLSAREVLEKKRQTIGFEIADDDVAKVYIHTLLRAGDHTSIEDADKFFYGLFFDPDRYDVSKEGRIKINETFGLDIPLDVRTLTKDDFIGIMKHILLLENDVVSPDDIDSLSNRRVSLVGELLYYEFRNGLLRMQRLIKDRMIMRDLDNITPYDVINVKPVAQAIKDFFATGQLSQFLDQTNILSEISNKRRLSALGPGGLTRERAGFEVRDVHPTHYGRICPIETPEGPNIGLISSLALYADINEYGFIETPYRKVYNGVVSDEVVYLSASQEKGHVIAQANAPLDPNGSFVNEYVSARKNGEFIVVRKDEVDLMDVSPNQVVSVAAGLIPFLEHDDANRALMGSNMQRQAVPLIKPEAPLVGTGLEGIVAKYSRRGVFAKRDGVVVRIDDDRLYVACRGDNGYEIDEYEIRRFIRSNQNTSFSQRPLVRAGDTVKKGQIIVDVPTCDKGELALGKNVLVAFVPWRGYNYEDGVVVSRRVVEEDIYTSIHIKELEVFARDTKVGVEEITADIPNVSADMLKNLDKNGIVRIGAYVKPGDIIVGKVTPKTETHYSPEERLLRAIFGEKAAEVTDTSLRVPSDVSGIVVDVKILKRRGAPQNQRGKEILRAQKEKLDRELREKLNLVERLKLKHFREEIAKSPLEKDVTVGRKTFKKGKTVTERELENLSESELKRFLKVSLVKDIEQHYKNLVKIANDVHSRKVKSLERDDELPPSVVMGVKVYIATKRKLSVGDKMSGRHGNKGVVSKILPIEDLPFLEDGTPVDIVLNPLGVPSRMNIGQIMETHLGLISKGLGRKIDELVKAGKRDAIRSLMKEIYDSTEVDEFIDSLSDNELDRYAVEWSNGVHFASPVFEGPKEGEFERLKKLAGVETFKFDLYDGVTGERFLEPVTVGVMYVLKLHHLVDDKVHARSVGPYSLVTQQPLGGKAQFGGQRFGEMEVWALEGYGASYSLQEMLTIKSDDISGRNKAYEALVKRRPVPLGGVPESFNVLVKEMQALGLDLELLKEVKRK